MQRRDGYDHIVPGYTYHIFDFEITTVRWKNNKVSRDIKNLTYTIQYYSINSVIELCADGMNGYDTKTMYKGLICLFVYTYLEK